MEAPLKRCASVIVPVLTSLICSWALVACGGSGGSSSSTTTGTSTTTTGSSGTTDTTKLPLGDNYVVNTAPSASARGYLYVCPGTTDANGPGTTTKGPWFNSDGTTWSLGTKTLYAVNGAEAWASSFAASVANSLRSLSGNGLPNHTTGTYPITAATSPEAFPYDKNDNRILENTVAWTGLPTSATLNATPTCLGGGAIGVFLTGARLYAAMDAKGRDARAWELGDDCGGHPAPGGVYHYHSLPGCGLDADVAGQHSALVGYIADGFGLYGQLGENGVALTNDDLDECHGHADATRGYHYHTTETFPYTVGCYRGTPIAAHP